MVSAKNRREAEGTLPEVCEPGWCLGRKFRISDLGNRWAFYSKNGTISFNWRSVMAPIWVFDYILVHEMAHMIERPHSKEFWRIVSRVMPDYGEHIRWLSENGTDCDL